MKTLFKNLLYSICNLINEIVISEDKNKYIDKELKEKEDLEKLIKQRHEEFKRQWNTES